MSNYSSDGPSTPLQREKIEELCTKFGLPRPQDVYVIRRNYDSEDYANATRFEMEMPKDLRKWLDDEEFQYTIARINLFFEQAEKVGCKMVCCCLLRFLTCHVIRLCKKSKMEKTLNRVQVFIQQQNKDVYHPKGLHIVDPRAVGLRHADFYPQQIEFRSITNGPIRNILEREREGQVTAQYSNNQRSRMNQVQPRP